MYKYGIVIPLIISAFIFSIFMLSIAFHIEFKQQKDWKYGFYWKNPLLVFGTLLLGLSIIDGIILLFNY